MKLFRKYSFYDVDEFFNEYFSGITDEVMDRRRDAIIEGKKTFKVYDDELKEIKSIKAKMEATFAAQDNAALLNNNGIELERAGAIDDAISKYEENILPGTWFTLHPYRRLCVIYRKRGDIQNEIRVIETALQRLSLIHI